jgi:hypothetical protein
MTGPEIIPQVYEVDTNAIYSPRFSGKAVSATIAKLKTPTTAPDRPWHTRAMIRRAGEFPNRNTEVDTAIAMYPKIKGDLRD